MIAPNTAIPAPKPGTQKTDTPQSLAGRLGDITPGTFSGGVVFAGGEAPVYQNTGNSEVAAIWPWWDNLLRPCAWTYRAMMRHPTVGYVMDQVVAWIYASEWLVDADPACPQAVIDWVTENIIAHRQRVIMHALRSLVFGNAPFEVVWGLRGGQYVIDDFVALQQDDTKVVRSRDGRGPIQHYENKGVTLEPVYAMYIKNEADLIGSEPGNDHGRSRLENIRDTAWRGWIETMRKLDDLETRVAGVIPIITVPAGKNEQDERFFDQAKKVLPTLSHPRSIGAVFEEPMYGPLGAGSSDPKDSRQLTTRVTPLDMSNRATSQSAMLSKAEYYDKLMARGLGRGERSVFATVGGIKADSEQHTENAEPDAETIDRMIATQVNEQPAMVGLLQNFGRDIFKVCRGIKPAPLVDKERLAALGLLKTAFTNTATAEIALAATDWEYLWDAAGSRLASKSPKLYKTFLKNMLERFNQPLTGEPGTNPASPPAAPKPPAK